MAALTAFLFCSLHILENNLLHVEHHIGDFLVSSFFFQFQARTLKNLLIYQPLCFLCSILAHQ